ARRPASTSSTGCSAPTTGWPSSTLPTPRRWPRSAPRSAARARCTPRPTSSSRPTTSARSCRRPAAPGSTSSLPATGDRRRPASRLVPLLLVIDDLVGVLRSAGDAPQLGLLDDVVRCRGLPRLGRYVDAPDEHQVLVGEGAVLADPVCHPVRLRSVCRREPWVPRTVEVRR